VIDRATGRLNDKGIHASHAFFQFDLYLTVAECADLCLPERDSEERTNLIRKLRIRIAGKYL
jgi:hypothetical protein